MNSTEHVTIGYPSRNDFREAQDLGDAFTKLPRFIRSHDCPSATSVKTGAMPSGSVQDVALLLADYVADYLSSFHNEPFVATRYEPAHGRLNGNRLWEEWHFQMHWEPLSARGRRTLYELSVGAHDLSFVASVLPGDRREARAVSNRLIANQEKLIDLAWENSIRFVDGVDFNAWQTWALSMNALLPFGHDKAPDRFSVCIEAGPITLPVNDDRVAYHVSDAVRRTAGVLVAV